MSAPCTYAALRVIRVSGIGGSAVSDPITVCVLVERSEEAKIAICAHHHAKGVGGAVVSIKCPMAVRGNWDDCGYYRPRRRTLAASGVEDVVHQP